MDLTGKVALITGASRGIGKACAVKMAELGANIVVNYSSNQVLAEEVVKHICSMGRKAIAIQADVSDQQEVEAMVEETIRILGSLDILINNAGITKDSLLIRMKEQDWNKVLATNLNSVFFTTKAAVRYMMKKRQGRIINISSVVGIAGNAGQASYAASKAGIIGFSKSVAKELAQRNILVNVIAPGFIQTDMTETLSAQQKEIILSAVPLKRYGSPEDVANLAAFLASEECSYLTGQVIHVDGGMNM
ncbi:MAG TPA: 3-oxoacyl-[acyl-carrier-protein] reductase [Clostridiales bacterium]|jgi:3-oxoacyl-[acyl-carrier protein] reductase|nr:3-oxoacyl-[acyl-carrier-protein] reductase [Clostridiales bacterium]